MSLINPINSASPTPPRLPESTGVLGFRPSPLLTASIFSGPGSSKGGTETTGVNSLNSSPSSSSGSSGCGSCLNTVT